MPLADPKVQAAIEELRRRGIQVGESQPAQVNLPATPGPGTADLQQNYAAAGAQPAQPAAPTAPMQVPPPGPSDPNVPPHLGGGQYPSQVALERNLRVKQLQGDLAIADAVNELKRRGINLKLRTASGQEEIVERGTDEALENARKQGDPEAFKNAWRSAFPGRPLPRKPDGSIDYESGADDLDVEIDRKKKLEAAKVGAHNIKEVKTTRLNPKTGKEEEYVVRIDSLTGQKLGETLIGESAKALTESQSNAKIYSTRMAQNNAIINQLENKSTFSPTAIGTTVQTFLPNRFRSEDLQSYIAAKRNWVAAVLRKESGAAISPKEYSEADAQYFPQDGDSKSVVEQKRTLRQTAEQQMREAVGPAAGALPEGTPAAPPTREGAPPTADSTPVPVKSAAEAPPTAKFIVSPKGRTYRNPKYTGP